MKSFCKLTFCVSKKLYSNFWDTTQNSFHCDRILRPTVCVLKKYMFLCRNLCTVYNYITIMWRWKMIFFLIFRLYDFLQKMLDLKTHRRPSNHENYIICSFTSVTWVAEVWFVQKRSNCLFLRSKPRHIYKF